MKSYIMATVSYIANRPYSSSFSKCPRLNPCFAFPYLKLIPRHFYKDTFPCLCKYITCRVIDENSPFWKSILSPWGQFILTSKLKKFTIFTHSRNKVRNPAPFSLLRFTHSTNMYWHYMPTDEKSHVYKDKQRSLCSRSLTSRLLIGQQISSWLIIISFMLPWFARI